MNKRELVNLVAKKTNLPRTKIENMLTEIYKMIIDVLSKGGEVSLRGFGKFTAKESQERIYRNLITKRPFYSSKKKYVYFRLFKNFKYSIK